MPQQETLETKNNATPPQVKADHLNKDGRLLSAEDVDTVKAYLGEEPDGRYSKKEFVNPQTGEPLLSKQYGIIKNNGSYYAVYLGSKHDNEERILGRGGYGKVKLAQNIETGEWFALKVQKPKIDINEVKKQGKTKGKKVNLKAQAKLEKAAEIEAKYEYETMTQAAVAEYTLLSKLGQGVGLVYKVPLPGEQKTGKMPTINILMNYIPGKALFKFLEEDFFSQDKQRNNDQKAVPISNEVCFQRAIGMVTALKSAHEKNLIHCDFKPDNCIFDEKTGQMSLCDLGSMKDLGDKKSIIVENAIGTPEYNAPEVMSEIQRYYEATAQGKPYTVEIPVSAATDIYALGISLQDVFGMHPLSKDEENTKLITNLSNDQNLISLISRMTSVDIDERPTLQEIESDLLKIQNQYLLQDTTDSKYSVDTPHPLIPDSGYITGTETVDETPKQPLSPTSSVTQEPFGAENTDNFNHSDKNNKLSASPDSSADIREVLLIQPAVFAEMSGDDTQLGRLEEMLNEAKEIIFVNETAYLDPDQQADLDVIKSTLEELETPEKLKIIIHAKAIIADNINDAKSQLEKLSTPGKVNKFTTLTQEVVKIDLSKNQEKDKKNLRSPAASSLLSQQSMFTQKDKKMSDKKPPSVELHINPHKTFKQGRG